MITNPTLPPMPGYVEVEIDGNRTYKNVKTGEIIGHETFVNEEDVGADMAYADIANAIKEGVDSV